MNDFISMNFLRLTEAEKARCSDSNDKELQAIVIIELLKAFFVVRMNAGSFKREMENHYYRRENIIFSLLCQSWAVGSI